MEKKYVIGVDIGGTKISCALSTFDGTIVKQFTVDTNSSRGESEVIDNLFVCIDKVMPQDHKERELISAIGVGSPGPLDSKEGVILFSANLPLKNFPIIKHITEKYSIPAYLENDANVAAIGEHMFGAGKGTNDMIFITVSTGVGGGAVLNGKIYRGSTSNSLEVGHMTILPDGPKCNCGNFGCLEVLSSGTAIGRQGREAVEKGIETSLAKYDKVTSYEVFKEAEAGDDTAQNIIDKSLNYLGIGIANIITTFDPEVVVIGGGVAKVGEVIFDKVKEVVSKRCMKTYIDSCRIVPAALGVNAGVMGAVALAILESADLANK